MNNVNQDTYGLRKVDAEGSSAQNPDYFEQAIASMSMAQVRPDILVSDIRPPRNLAPLSHAIGLEVSSKSRDDQEHGDAFGRLILLHDPAGDEGWSGAKMRLVSYIQADIEAAIAADPLLPEVAWDWLTESLNSPVSPYTDLGGTVTSTTSVRYGEIGGPPRAFQLEMRASWTANGVDLEGHVQAFARVLANVAGLPPSGVSALGR